VDATWASTAVTRTRGRRPTGERLVMAAPTAVGGAMTGDLSEAYARQQLAPTLAPGDAVVMDNLACHTRAGGAAAGRRTCRRTARTPTRSGRRSASSRPGGGRRPSGRWTRWGTDPAG